MKHALANGVTLKGYQRTNATVDLTSSLNQRSLSIPKMHSIDIAQITDDHRLLLLAAVSPRLLFDEEALRGWLEGEKRNTPYVVVFVICDCN